VYTETELRTERLILRPIEMSDSVAFFDIFSDVQTLQYWGREPVRTHQEAEALIRKELDWAASESCFSWGIALADSNLLIGKITLFQFNEQNRRAEIGYVLDRGYWDKGYMTEALTAVLTYAFDALHLRRIEADTDPDNTASLALLEKFGFQQEGLFRKRWLVNGKWADSVMLGLLTEDLQKPL